MTDYLEKILEAAAEMTRKDLYDLVVAFVKWMNQDENETFYEFYKANQMHFFSYEKEEVEVVDL